MKFTPIRAILITLASALFTAGCGCAYASTESAEVGCVFEGGPLDSREFREYTKPGSGRQQVGWESNVIEAPLRLVTYQISLVEGQGDTPKSDHLPVNVGGMPMKFEPTVAMRFNTKILDPDGEAKPVVCQFIEEHLRPFGATDFNTAGGVWHYQWLADRFRPWVDVAGVRVLQEFNDPVALFHNHPVDDGNDDLPVGYRDRAAVRLGEELSEELEAALGGEFFCSPDHDFGGTECGDVRVTLPQPHVSAEDEAILKAPQRARTEADAAIAEAAEEARKAAEVAQYRATEAESAEAKADADEKIAQEQGRTVRVDEELNYEWCRVLIELGESCWLVRAAENGSLPAVLGGDAVPDILVSAGAVPEPE